MWDLNLKTGNNPLDILSTRIGDVSPRTTQYRGAARKNARDPKVGERDGATYVNKSLGDGARFNRHGEYRVSQTEAKRIKSERDYMDRVAAATRRRQDAIIAEMLAEQNALMAQYNKNR